jgi:hypothetical protein
MITENTNTEPRLELFEILEKLDKTENREKRVEGLRYFNGKYPSLSDYLRCLHDDTIQFRLPEGKPPYTPAHEAYYPSTWHKKHMDLKFFVIGLLADDMNSTRRESRWIQLLESVHPEDAVIISDVSDKKSPYEWLTLDLVKEALPNLIK